MTIIVNNTADDYDDDYDNDDGWRLRRKQVRLL